MNKYTVPLTIELGPDTTPEDLPDVAQDINVALALAADGWEAPAITAADFRPVTGPGQRKVWLSVDEDGRRAMWPEQCKPFCPSEGDMCHGEWLGDGVLLGNHEDAEVAARFGDQTFGVAPGECKLVLVDWPDELDD